MPAMGFAHGGGLNADGCHTNRKTGDYHCHRQQIRIQAPIPAANQDGFGWSFKNCTEARAAGAAPVRVSEPGYGYHLDRDRDGVGCE